jgi:hypothetical protein
VGGINLEAGSIVPGDRFNGYKVETVSTTPDERIQIGGHDDAGIRRADVLGIHVVVEVERLPQDQ